MLKAKVYKKAIRNSIALHFASLMVNLSWRVKTFVLEENYNSAVTLLLVGGSNFVVCRVKVSRTSLLIRVNKRSVILPQAVELSRKL